MAGRRLAILLLLALCGCPTGSEDAPPADMAPPPANVRDAPDDDTPTPPTDDGEETPTVSPSEEPQRDSLTRAELLALEPADVLSAGLRGAGIQGLAPKLAGVGVLALGEQLQAAAVPQEALDLCVVAFDRARDKLPAGQQLSEGGFQKLEKDLAVQSRGMPKLAAWTSAMLDQVTSREDLDAAVTFLLRAKAAWNTSAALEKLPPPG